MSLVEPIVVIFVIFFVFWLQIVIEPIAKTCLFKKTEILQKKKKKKKQNEKIQIKILIFEIFLLKT